MSKQYESALMNDEDFIEDCRSASRRDEVETVRCVCGVVLNKDDAVRAEDDESWLCGDCAAWIKAVCK